MSKGQQPKQDENVRKHDSFVNYKKVYLEEILLRAE